jgi:NOL1/NOP2/fmu family ribosome biogenesis protein
MLKKGFGKNTPAQKLYLFFNKTHDVPETITLNDIKEEISRRGIKIGQEKDSG